MKDLKYNLHVKGFVGIENHKLEIDFDVNDEGVNAAHKLNGQKLQDWIEERLGLNLHYEVDIKGYISIFGLKLDIDESFKK